MPANDPGCVRFGPYNFNLVRGELRKHGNRLRAQHQQIELLQALLKTPGQILSREELRQRLWPTGLHVDFERNLNRSVNKLRDLLCDDPSRPRYIETVQGQGYRFIAELMPAADSVIAEEAQLLSTSQDASSTISSRLPVVAEVTEQTRLQPYLPARRFADLASYVWFLRLEIGLGLVSCVLFLFSWSPHRSGNIKTTAAASPGKLRIAVLPFANLTGNEKDQYLCDGLTDETIAQLGRLDPGRLSVIGWASAMHFNGARDLNELSAALHVEYVLRSSVRGSPDKLRVTTELVRVSDQSDVWTGEFDRTIEDIFDVQKGVALAVASKTNLALTPEGEAELRRNHRVDGAAFREYLTGRFYWERRDKSSLLEAIAHFESALAADPGFAPAYAGIADSYLVLGGGYLPAHESYTRGRQAAAQAVQLDPELAEAHTSLGYFNFIDAWNWIGSEREFKRAIEINGGFATAHHWYALYLAGMARYPEAISEIETALALDPMSIVINCNAGAIYAQAEQYDRAIEQFQKALAIEPNLAQAHGGLGLAYELRGQYGEALAEFEKAQQLNGTIVQYAGDIARTYALTGDTQRARQVLTQLLALSNKSHVPSYNVVICYAALGDRDHALQWLERALQEREFAATDLATDPRISELRRDARFGALRRLAHL